MDYQPYMAGFRQADSGPLARFLPALEDGVISAWLGHQDSLRAQAGNWLLDPFGFSPRLDLEAARSGYRVLVTANNPITRFLLEIFADPPEESEFVAALADLGAVKKGDERLETHLQSLYLTACEKCGQQIEAQAFLWRKGEDAPYARIYECKNCGDSGERSVTEEDVSRAKAIAGTDSLHRSRALERVVSLNDPDRVYAEEAIQHYLPRPLYVLTTIINRLDSLNLNPIRRRALTALILLACDAGNTLWAHPAERPRPKQLSTPNQFREHNVWMMLERGATLFAQTGGQVRCETWPAKLPPSGGICIYEGRLKDLAEEVKREIPIAAVIAAFPRPNQAFWTFSALWAGWLWGSTAAEPYKLALRRRRYDWAWNATALSAVFNHLNELLADAVPVFGLLAEPEAAFLTSAFSAAQTAGFSLQSVAVRTAHDAAQVIWHSASKRESSVAETDTARSAIIRYLTERGEPAAYLHVHAAALIALEDLGALAARAEFDDSLRNTNTVIETALKADSRFAHYSGGEAVESGLWGLRSAADANGAHESISDRVEVELVTHLQKYPNAIYIEIENELYSKFPGLLTPSKGLIYAVLNSYAEKDGASWKLRPEDAAAARREEMNRVIELLETLGGRFGYQTRTEDKRVIWEQDHEVIRSFFVLASALLGRALANIDDSTAIVIPGGRAALAAYKQERDPALAARIKNHMVIKYRLLRAVLELPILTRETFEEQIASDPVEQSKGQLMMF